MSLVLCNRQFPNKKWGDTVTVYRRKLLLITAYYCNTIYIGQIVINDIKHQTSCTEKSC
jgi:hypothetical protein